MTNTNTNPTNTMKTILKYPCRPEISMPTGATIIHVGFDPTIASIAIWALVDPKAKPTTRRFSVLQTGQPAQDSIEDCAHLGTAVLAVKTEDGKLKTIVEHVWEVPEHVYKQARAKEGQA